MLHIFSIRSIGVLLILFFLTSIIAVHYFPRIEVKSEIIFVENFMSSVSENCYLTHLPISNKHFRQFCFSNEAERV